MRGHAVCVYADHFQATAATYWDGDDNPDRDGRANRYRHRDIRAADNRADENAIAAAAGYPVRIVDIDKGAETVTLRNVTTGDTIDLSSWDMCSIAGNQQPSYLWHARVRSDADVRRTGWLHLEQQQRRRPARCIMTRASWSATGMIEL
jgi:hypothetical protein